ncbi:MAG: hypothetical protein AB7V62_00630 [Thermoleophilia bacterium]
MDLRLLGRVLWRYRYLVVAGWVLACAAAFFSFVKVDGEGLSYRQSETYSAYQDVFVTERGFAEGRATLGDPEAPAADEPVTSDPDRLIGLTTLYAQLVDSDPVREIMLQDGPIEGYVVAEQFTANSGRAGLPILRITAFAPTAEAAIDTTLRQSDAFAQFIREEQARNEIPAADRVVLNVLRAPDGALLEEGRSITTPAIVFLAILAATFALALLLNNLRPPRAGDDPQGVWRDIRPDDIIASEGDRVRVPGESEQR